VVFSPDGKMLAGGGFAGLTLVWDTESGKEISRFVTVPNSIVTDPGLKPRAGL
jgi:WD40 repeat protein